MAWLISYYEPQKNPSCPTGPEWNMIVSRDMTPIEWVTEMAIRQPPLVLLHAEEIKGFAQQETLERIYGYSIREL